MVDYGSSQRYWFLPATGYHVDSVVVDGARTDSVAGYTFANIMSDHSIQAYFGVNQYTIVASAGLHGAILPAGAIPVAYGSSILFSMMPDSGYGIDSLVVDGIAVSPATSYQFVNITSDHSIWAAFDTTTLLMRQYPVSGGWNLVSLPMTVSDPRKQSVFPTATSSAFRFDPGLGYVVGDTLRYGLGYWLQFANQQSVSISGVARSVDTVQVVAGWNLIGSITDARPVSLILQLPPAIVASPFFGYAGSYAASDTIRPAAAYWVKVSQNGQLILR
jgi:hypothetical protein